MEPINPPKTLKLYQLVRQNGLSFSTSSAMSQPISLGCGFFYSLNEAEMHRTNEVLKESSLPKSKWHIFELEVPNPAHGEQKD